MNIWQLKALKQNILCGSTGKLSKQIKTRKDKMNLCYNLIIKAKRKTKNSNFFFMIFLDTWNEDKLGGRNID